jgi:uncharacterized Zn-binding protein involved in type VI secretion
MSGKPAARQSDPTSCPVPGHGTNPIATGSPNVLFDNLPAARLSDTSACGSPIAGAVASTVLINGLPAATLGSTGGHGSVVIGGSGSVIIGNSAVAAPFTAPTPLSLAAAPPAATKASENQPPATALAAQPAQQATTAPAIAQPAQTIDRVAAAKQIVDTFESSASQTRVFNDRAHPMGTASDPSEILVYQSRRDRSIRQHPIPRAYQSGEIPGTVELCGQPTSCHLADLCCDGGGRRWGRKKPLDRLGKGSADSKRSSRPDHLAGGRYCRF